MLKDIIDWDVVMVQPRFAGGHEEIMETLFKGATVIARHIENDYQGELGFAYKLEDGRYVLTTDYFGSCSGCDSYEDCTDEELKNLCVQLANNSKIFDNISSMLNFLRDVKSDQAVNYSFRNVAAPLISELYKNRIVKIDEILGAE